MSELPIEKIPATDDRSFPLFAEFDEIIERIRARANEIAASRGFDFGKELDDWLAAEKEICWTASELIERDDKFLLKVALAGFEPTEITVAATPTELMIKAEHVIKREVPRGDKAGVRWSELQTDDVYRRVELPVEVDTDRITARFERGLLTISAPKAITTTTDTSEPRIITTA